MAKTIAKTLGYIATFLAMSLVAQLSYATHNSDEEIESRLKKVGRLNVVEATAAASDGPIDPAVVYQSTCSSCHGSGVLGAPKLDDAAQWAKRLANGVEAVYSNGIKGLNAMPPKGGANLSDDDFKKIVDYMIDQSK